MNKYLPDFSPKLFKIRRCQRILYPNLLDRRRQTHRSVALNDRNGVFLGRDFVADGNTLEPITGAKKRRGSDVAVVQKFTAPGGCTRNFILADIIIAIYVICKCKVVN